MTRFWLSPIMLMVGKSLPTGSENSLSDRKRIDVVSENLCETTPNERGRNIIVAKRVALAYSGGLDTSVAVHWLQKECGLEVIAVACDVGQGGDFEAIRQRALAAGAIEAVVIDAREELAGDFVVPALQANAMYEGRYPLVSALSRPVIVRHLVEQARIHGASAVAHGCTGKGNDQVRFEVGTRALAPDLEVIAPARVWGLTREDCIEYAAKWDIPISVTKEKLYSIDENLWGRAIECGVIEDPWNQPPADVYTMTRPTATEPVSLIHISEPTRQAEISY